MRMEPLFCTKCPTSEPRLLPESSFCTQWNCEAC